MKKEMIKICSYLLMGILLISTADASAGGAEAGVPWMKIIFHVINLIILVFIIVRFGKKPIQDFFQNRHDTLRKALDEAEAEKQKAEEKYREYQEKLENIEKEIQDITGLLRKDGSNEKELVLKNARDLAERMKKDAQMSAEQEIAKARYELRKEAVRLAVQMAEEKLQKEMKDDDQTRLAEENINNIKGLQ